MTPTLIKIHVLALLLLVFFTPLQAREEAAAAELQSAAKALALATDEGAATYAPLDLRYAGEQLEQARQLLGQGEEKQARQLLEQSRVNSDLAMAKSRLGRTREAVQVQAAANAQLRTGAPVPPADNP
jgi:predicted NBD/HSP70 family sugar kinase